MTCRSRFTLCVGSMLMFLLMARAHAQTSDQQSQSQDHHDAMMHRGEKGMGFSQTATTHHFLLRPDGGVISVAAKDPKDTTGRDQIRMHLQHIARAFSEGEFDIPMFVHDREPDGVATMKRLAKEIHYEFRETDRGGEVAIGTKSKEAVQAIHDFLSFQIREHKTGDPVAVP